MKAKKTAKNPNGSQGVPAKIPESYCMPKPTKKTKFPA